MTALFLMIIRAKRYKTHDYAYTRRMSNTLIKKILPFFNKMQYDMS